MFEDYNSGQSDCKPVEIIQRRHVTLSVVRVQVRLYRRTKTMSDVCREPAHFEYLVRVEWSGDSKPRPGAVGSPRSPRDACGFGTPGWRFNVRPSLPYSPWEDPSAWWETLPKSYVVPRRWRDFIAFHKALIGDLIYDKRSECNRTKSRPPVLPSKGDVDGWLQEYAAIGDWCALSRKAPNPPSAANVPRKRFDPLDELKDLHWLYVKNRLAPYLAEVSRILSELPTEILAASRALRRFVTGGVSGQRQLPPMLVQRRNLGVHEPLRADPKDVAQGAALLRRAQSAPVLAAKGADKASGSGGKGQGAGVSWRTSPSSPSKSAAKLSLSRTR